MSNNGTKKKVLLTSFGNKLLYEFWSDFAAKGAFELFISDAAQAARPQSVTRNILKTKMGTEEGFGEDLLQLCRQNGIDFVIPGSDEEALALMPVQAKFSEHGILTAVQEEGLSGIFSSKYAMYEYLRTKNFPLPEYRLLRRPEDIEEAFISLDYGKRELLIKPDAARGGKGIYVINESHGPNSEGLPVISSAQLVSMIDGTQNYLLMPYLKGVICDVDVLTYKNGDVFFGPRERFENVTKLFSGNTFSNNPSVMRYVKNLYAALPTKFLIDYDLMITDDGAIELLEINPRPSGSTISYLPYEYNLYAILAESYLHNRHIKVDYQTLSAKKSFVFCKMVKESV